MARDWKLATAELRCGSQPDCVIRRGEAYCVLTSPERGEKWAKVRCQRHAGEEAPAEVYQPSRQASEPSGFTGTRQLARTLPWKPRAMRDGKQLATQEKAMSEHAEFVKAMTEALADFSSATSATERHLAVAAMERALQERDQPRAVSCYACASRPAEEGPCWACGGPVTAAEEE